MNNYNFIFTIVEGGGDLIIISGTSYNKGVLLWH